LGQNARSEPIERAGDAIVVQTRQKSQTLTPWTKEEEQEIQRRFEGGETIPAIARSRKNVRPLLLNCVLQRLGVRVQHRKVKLAFPVRGSGPFRRVGPSITGRIESEAMTIRRRSLARCRKLPETRRFALNPRFTIVAWVDLSVWLVYKKTIFFLAEE